MRNDWNDDDYRQAVVFRVRCSTCQKLVGEYQVRLYWDYENNIDFIRGKGRDKEEVLTNSLQWVKYDPADYAVGLASHSVNPKTGIEHVGKLCEHVWGDEGPKLLPSDSHRGLVFLRELEQYDRALRHQERIDNFNKGQNHFATVPDPLSAEETAILHREQQPHTKGGPVYAWNWHENGLTILREPPTSPIWHPKQDPWPSKQDPWDSVPF